VNWIHLLVQIVEEIEEEVVDGNILETRYLAIPIKKDKNFEKKNSFVLSFSIWQNSDRSLKDSPNISEQSYKINDLVLIEGFLTKRKNREPSSKFIQKEFFEISVLNHSFYR
jgi:hypothetical protein